MEGKTKLTTGPIWDMLVEANSLPSWQCVIDTSGGPSFSMGDDFLGHFESLGLWIDEGVENWSGIPSKVDFISIDKVCFNPGSQFRSSNASLSANHKSNVAGATRSAPVTAVHSFERLGVGR